MECPSCRSRMITHDLFYDYYVCNNCGITWREEEGK